jgi:hypothetical protein
VTTAATPSTAAPVEMPPLNLRPLVSGSKVPGIPDSQLHSTLHEAHRVLTAAADAWAKALENIEGQFIRPLLNSHDGDNEACTQVKTQIAAFRGLYL